MENKKKQYTRARQYRCRNCDFEGRGRMPELEHLQRADDIKFALEFKHKFSYEAQTVFRSEGSQ